MHSTCAVHVGEPKTAACARCAKCAGPVALCASCVQRPERIVVRAYGIFPMTKRTHLKIQIPVVSIGALILLGAFGFWASGAAVAVRLFTLFAPLLAAELVELVLILRRYEQEEREARRR